MGYGYGSTFKQCHNGPKEVMHIGNVSVWAGSFAEVRGDFDWDIILRFSEHDFPLHNISMFNDEAKKVFSKVLEKGPNAPAIIDIYWEDFGLPQLKDHWWKTFNTSLLKMKQSVMLVHCLGGHGRTGTGLAILAALNGYHKKRKDNDPVAFIRQRYCESAVEGSLQIEYIEAITGVKVTAKGSSFAGFYSKHNIANEPSTTTSGYVYQLKNDLQAGSAYTIKIGELKGEIEARWMDQGKNYIFADNKLYEELPDGQCLLEIDWSSGSYTGVSEHRKLTGGM